ncbi:cell division protein FtsK [Actinocorallia sp. API 0066]|uniref:FtsK/SpoIIIE domain-containing protein n=1 Tax=Actinocorallia sp. API 0066 TaxID=2896846 RepID=UPI001E4C7979|nr:FtsK/SpoIIIE domain-containing protein [Actinocorallia sp. API 0066]MCD0451948.1 cell division protein FtsK [Actinocorallia sp. API 0066]
MSWSIRKSRLGENVAVETSEDPFRRPRWEPPVLHMPMGLLLLVQTFQTLFFAVRHCVPLGVLGGAAWVVHVHGWLPVVLVVMALIVGLTGWALADRASFLRWVGWPALARCRRTFVYARHWEAVMTMTGLSRSRKGREYLPTLVRVRCRATSDLVLVKMLKGQTPEAWEKSAVGLAHGFGAVLVRVRAHKRPGRVWLEFVRSDALKTPIPALPLLEDATEVDLRAVPIGRQEDGSPWLIRLLGTHVLMVGATGSGKGSILWSIVRGVLEPMRAGLVEVWAVDPKRMELSYGRPLFERYGRYSSDPSGGMVQLLEDAAADMNARAARFAGKTRTFTPSVEHPFRLVVVDEMAFLTAYCPERDLRKRAESALAVLTTQGRSVGYCVVGAQQDARKEVNTLRNLFPDRIALRLDEDEQVDMVLGDGSRDRGAFADQISSDPVIGAGVAFVRLETSPDPVRVRAAYVSDDDISEMVALAVPLRPIPFREAA